MTTIFWARAIASLAVCALGIGAMYFSDGKTGIGWAILGILIIWGVGISFRKDEEKKGGGA